MEDEAALLLVMEQFLARHGYQVDACASASEALQRFEADPAAYSLVVADIIMPEMSGSEVILKLLERNPRLCVLICSGSPLSLAMLPAGFRGQVGFLLKPFAPQMLAEAVRGLLGSQRGQGAGAS